MAAAGLHVGGGSSETMSATLEAETKPRAVTREELTRVENPAIRPFNRKLAAPLTRLFAWTPITPNQITTLSLACGVGAGWCLMQGRWGLGLVAACLLQLSYVLDNCDGEIARLKGLSSAWGSWYDTIADGVIHVTFFAGLAIGLYRIEPVPKWAVLGWLVTIGVLCCYGVTFLEKWRQFGPAVFGHPDAFGPRAHRTIDTIVRELSRGDFSHVAFVALLFGWAPWLLWVAAIGSHVYWVSDLAINWRPIFLPRSLRDAQETPQPANDSVTGGGDGVAMREHGPTRI